MYYHECMNVVSEPKYVITNYEMILNFKQQNFEDVTQVNHLIDWV